MVRRRLLAGLIVSLVSVGCGGSGTAVRTETTPRKAGIDPALARALQRTLDQQRDFFGLPGAAAAVVIPGAGMWSGGSGLADRATGTRATADTPFAIASLTKTFVGALAVRLAADGRLRLDDRLSRWLPRWPRADRITLRQLLNQTSGVSQFGARLSDPINRAIDRRPRSFWSPQRVLGYAGRPEAAPGARWEYNDANYVLAGLAIERATRSTAARALRARILDPLGLDDAVLQPQERGRRPGAHGYGRTRGDRHERDLSDGTGFHPYRSLASAAWTAAGMVASAPSVARFADAALRGPLLTPAGRRDLLAFVPADNLAYIRYGLGIGEGFSNRMSTNVWAALGGTSGFGATLVHHPERHITVVVLSNQDESTQFTVQIADLLLEQAVGRR
jgi:D-alanyl-D-alanine carboxypeptidase